jgi:hypothetical protein
MSEVYVLDFDGTLANIDNMVYELFAAAEEIEDGLGQKLMAYNNERMKDGDDRAMFQPELVLKEKTAEVFEVFARLMAESGKEYMPADAERLLKNIAELGKTAIVLTFGDKIWQKAKVDAVLRVKGYDIPVMYTEEKIKSKVLSAAWSKVDQEYQFKIETDDGIITVSATDLVGIGDELTDFEGYDKLKNARGYYKTKVQPAPGALPGNVVPIPSLDETDLAA